MLPNILPGILSGLTMAFARAVGEVGSMILITGNLPVQDGGRVDVHPASASTAIRTARQPSSVVLLTISFAVLLLGRRFRRYATRHERA